MPTKRTRRRRAPVEPDTISALRSGARIRYSAENWNLLLAAFYFGDPKLKDAELARCREFLDRWWPRLIAAEQRARRAN